MGRADVDVTVTRQRPSTVSWIGLVLGLIGGLGALAQLFNVVGGSFYGWRHETSLEADQAARTDDRLKGLEVSVQGVQTALATATANLTASIEQRFAQEVAAREGVNRASEERHNAVLREMQVAVDLMNKRQDAIVQSLVTLRAELRDSTDTVFTLKGMVLGRTGGQLQSFGIPEPRREMPKPGPAVPDSTIPHALPGPRHEETAQIRVVPW